MSSCTIISPIRSYCSMLQPSAQRIYVGRRGRGQYQDQTDINRLLIERAKEGNVVVRLKGGDPFVFGRGGEEAEAVAAAGIDFEIVPGVTAAVAVPAYAGIPVTHRTLASTVTFVTGHEDPTKPETQLEWPKLASTSGTLVFMMGMKNLPSIVRQLLSEGRSSEPAGRRDPLGDQSRSTNHCGDIGRYCCKSGSGAS